MDMTNYVRLAAFPCQVSKTQCAASSWRNLIPMILGQPLGVRAGGARNMITDGLGLGLS